MDELQDASDDKAAMWVKVLSIPCPTCGRRAGQRCVDAGGAECYGLGRQHVLRVERSGVRVGTLRALLAKRGLI
ncbi:zinc finger domain-containing protein [Tenggerimyces flavus]|uniref:DNA-binding phage zinc finger domain-containing protein n=1 Tax=Tenggerimyces flavus TaxID=1708749 RepID=A0ABV7Y3E2_9ACTN|nr:hypothetical protein [Tenggerimyces flavus]MBM7788683.1 hypothetical protein [Tenggerimyces flavus]